VIRSHLKINIILVFIFLSGCSSNDTLIIKRRIKTGTNSGHELTGRSEKPAGILNTSSDRSFIIYKTERRFKGNAISGPAGEITRQGIIEAEKGCYTEAEFLFNETASIYTDGTAQNNIAVIYEASGKYDKAFSMYARALILSPDEKIFRSNFLLFLNQNYHEENFKNKRTGR